MLTPNQKKYLRTIPAGKVANIRPFNPKVKTTAKGIIKQIKKEFPELKITFMGAAALGIAGQNDIDLNALSIPEEYAKYLPALIKLFGKPVKISSNLVKWEFQKHGFDTELYLTDKNSPLLREQVKTFKILRGSPNYRKEYQQIKLSCDGLPLRKYMKRKYEFFNRIIQ